jgi:hypothetical protein
VAAPAEREEHADAARHARQRREQRAGLRELRPLRGAVRPEERGDLVRVTVRVTVTV